MVKLREKNNLLIPTLNGCITRFKIREEICAKGRYFSKYMAKEIIDKYNLKISEIEYYSLVKSYRGVIDIDELEDNLIEVSNQQIFLKFPKFKVELEKVFNTCGHTHHRMISRREKFGIKDYEKYNRFFKDKNLFRTFRFEDITSQRTKIRNREAELATKFKENSFNCININSNFLNSLLTKLRNDDFDECSVRGSFKKSSKSKGRRRSSTPDGEKRFQTE